MPRNLQADISPPPFAGAMVSNALKAMRQTRGYSLEELSFACGLATHELAALESGMDVDPAKLRRIASALQLPETAFTGA
jgi:transcriptional regulator with XRE-family HTH domain